MSLFNGFIVCAVVLVSGVNVGGAALIMSAIGLLTSGHLAVRLARYHTRLHGQRPMWTHLARLIAPSLSGLVFFASEGALGVRLLARPADAGSMRVLALDIVGIYTLGLVRAWTLLGGPRHGVSGWLNSLDDLESTRPAGATSPTPDGEDYSAGYQTDSTGGPDGAVRDRRG